MSAVQMRDNIRQIIQKKHKDVLKKSADVTENNVSIIFIKRSGVKQFEGRIFPTEPNSQFFILELQIIYHVLIFTIMIRINVLLLLPKGINYSRKTYQCISKTTIQL